MVAYTPTRRRGISTPSETIRTATSHSSVLAAKPAMRSDADGSSEVTSTGVTWKRQVSTSRDRSRVLLVGGDDQAASIGLLVADLGQPVDGIAQDRR